jgi:hypothetical protein
MNYLAQLALIQRPQRIWAPNVRVVRECLASIQHVTLHSTKKFSWIQMSTLTLLSHVHNVLCAA